MSDDQIRLEMQGYIDHCMNTGQEQVADLCQRTLVELQAAHARYAGGGWNTVMVDKGALGMVKNVMYRAGKHECMDALLATATDTPAKPKVPDGWRFTRAGGGITIEPPSGGYLSVKPKRPANTCAHELLHDLCAAMLASQEGGE